MKKLVCEMCGSTDLIKDGGVFVCQYCGCKYSVEEARKMMIDGTVEVTGTVKVDETEKKREQVSNYIQMAQTAYSSNDTDGAVSYCDKALELDPQCYEAWVLKAKTAGWGSSLKNIKTPQSITGAKKAVELAPEDKKYEIAEEMYYAIKAQVLGLLPNAIKMPLGTVGYIQRVFMTWLSVLKEIPYLRKELIEKEIEDCQTACQNSKNAVSPSARKIYAEYFSVNKNVSYDKTFREHLAEKMELEDRRYKELTEKVAKKKAERKAAYWESHADERIRLEHDLENLKAQATDLEKKLGAVYEDDTVKDLEAMIDSKVKEKGRLGMFKAKEKRALQSEIDELNIKLADAKKAVENSATPIMEELAEVKAKISSITDELEKDR